MKKLICIIWILMMFSLFSCGSRNPEELPLHAMSVREMFPGDSKAQALALAAADGDVERMNKLVARGADVNARGSHGVTLPTWVVQHPNKKGFKHLMELGADPNIHWKDGDTLLHWVALMSSSMDTGIDVEYLQMALEIGGGDPNVERTPIGTRPIEHVISKRDEEAFVVLYNAGAEIDYVDNEGYSLLSKVVGVNQELAYFMLKQGVDFTIEAKEAKEKRRKWYEERGLEYFKGPGPDVLWNLKTYIGMKMKSSGDSGPKLIAENMWLWRCVDFLEREGMTFDFLPENLRPTVLDTIPPSYSFKVHKR